MASSFEVLGKVDSLMGARRNLARLSNVVGSGGGTRALPAHGESTVGSFMSRFPIEADVQDGPGTVVGAVAGAYLFRNKPLRKQLVATWLGGSIGRNAPALLQPSERSAAMRNLITSGGGAALSLYWKRHPILGFAAGLLGGGTIARLLGFK